MEIFKKVKVYTDLDNVSFNKPVVTVGVFDGLHRGHQQLLRLLREKSIETGGESVVVTFWPHPRLVLGKEQKDFFLLTTLEEKEHLFRNWGIDNLVILPFTKEFAGIPGSSFISDILVGRIGMKYFVIGDDHRFGSDREGGLGLVSELSEKYGYDFTRLDSSMEKEIRISSSQVRSALKNGRLDEANKLLGFPYFMYGKVVEGNKLGRKIGFPTANIACCVDNKQVPEDGVYIVSVEYNGDKHGGMLNIGTRPTVNHSSEKSIEVHIFDLSGDLYHEKLKVSFLHRLRDEMKFNNIDELKNQLKKDKENAINWLIINKMNL